MLFKRSITCYGVLQAIKPLTPNLELLSTHSTTMPSSETNVVSLHIPSVIKVYKDGKVERIWGAPHVEPSSKDPTTGVSSKDITISPHVSARLYLPDINSPETKLPVFVYHHGGAFCLESAFSEAHYSYLNTLASEANCLIVSVEYRLGPEHPLPAAYEDSWTALQWVASHAVQDLTEGQEKDIWLIRHADFEKLFIGGDSAGANIVHYMALRAGTGDLRGGVKILGAILSFPYFWGSKPVGSESIVTFEKNRSKELWELLYPTAPGGTDSSLFNPFVDGAPSLNGLACSKIFVCTAETDKLRERALYYVEFVKKGGWNGEIELVDVEGEGHCFQVFKPLCGRDPCPAKAKELISRIAHFIMQ